MEPLNELSTVLLTSNGVLMNAFQQLYNKTLVCYEVINFRLDFEGNDFANDLYDILIELKVI